MTEPTRTALLFVFIVGLGVAGIVIIAHRCPIRTLDSPVGGQTANITADIRLNPVESEYETISMIVTAYCPCRKCCGKWADGQTASGHRIKDGDKFVAAPPQYPFGTIMDVPYYGIVPVADRGGAIKGKRLDVFFHSHEEALKWGRRKLEVDCKQP